MNISKLKEELLKQRNSKTKGNIYHFSQVNFAYNSNKIEGSKISEEQTEEIFDTNSLLNKDSSLIKEDDIIETSNHFKLFDYMLDIVDEELTKEFIIKMNVILKSNTSDSRDPKYNVGGFKTSENIIGLINVINTSKPEDVEKDIDELLNWYNSLDNVTIEDIVEFHYRFESIHPFGDGNGRVGRMIMFKECLKNNIMPCIILDSDKPFYMRGLQQYKDDKLFLIDTIKNEQDIYEKISNDLLEIDLNDNL
jgi:Fic family protein